MARPATTDEVPMSETPPIGTPFHAVILLPLSDKFPVTGEVVVAKILNEQGDFRLRSRHPGPFQQTEEFCNSHLVHIRIVPDTDKRFTFPCTRGRWQHPASHRSSRR